MLLRRLRGGGPSHTEPPPHPLDNFPKLAIAYNNLNLSNCCLQINDEGKVIEEITNKMKNLAHVPVQTWKCWSPNDLFWGLALNPRWVQDLNGATFLVLGVCLILPC
jgi:hypothetical protein